MPRCARIYVDNACYHMLSRGIDKYAVFIDIDDFTTYIKLAHRYKIRCGCRIYAYALMPNHTHLVAEFPRGLRSMSQFMHGLNQTYAMIFNNKYKRVGHLWQNRYKNLIVAKNEYLLNLIDYVENNPVRSGLAQKPEDYPWSSYRSRTLGKTNIILDKI